MAEHCSSIPCTGPHLSLHPVPCPLLPSPGQLQAHLRLLLQHQQALVPLLRSEEAEWSWVSYCCPGLHLTMVLQHLPAAVHAVLQRLT